MEPTITPTLTATATLTPTATMTPTPGITQTVQLAFPPFVADADGARGDALLRALVIVFVMVLMHTLYSLYAAGRLTENVLLLEDLLILSVFIAFELLLLWMPDRVDLQAAAFTLWLTLFMVRALLRALLHAMQ